MYEGHVLYLAVDAGGKWRHEGTGDKGTQREGVGGARGNDVKICSKTAGDNGFYGRERRVRRRGGAGGREGTSISGQYR